MAAAAGAAVPVQVVDFDAIATIALAAVPLAGAANGLFYVNTASPTAAFISANSFWALTRDNHQNLTVEVPALAAVLAACRADLSAVELAARPAEEKMTIFSAIGMVLGRLACSKFYEVGLDQLNRAETYELSAAQIMATVHPDHAEAFNEAVAAWNEAAPRLCHLLVYAAISFETTGHHHVPRLTKRLATTTMSLLGIKEVVNTYGDCEGVLMHDMMHPIVTGVYSNVARDDSLKGALEAAKLANLAKRLPIKAADCGTALNYPILHAKASAYCVQGGVFGMNAVFTPPAALLDAITEYRAASTPEQLAAVVAILRHFSTILSEPSVYVVGVMLGADARAQNDPELTLRLAKRTNTILGAPAYERAAGEFPATFALGRERGFKNVDAATMAAHTNARIPVLANTVTALTVPPALAAALAAANAAAVVPAVVPAVP